MKVETDLKKSKEVKENEILNSKPWSTPTGFFTLACSWDSGLRTQAWTGIINILYLSPAHFVVPVRVGPVTPTL